VRALASFPPGPSQRSCPVPSCPVPTCGWGLGHEFRGSPSYQKFVTRPNPWYFPLATSDTTRLPGILFSSRRVSRRAAAIMKVSGPDFWPREVERRALNRRAQRSQRGGVTECVSLCDLCDLLLIAFVPDSGKCPDRILDPQTSCACLVPSCLGGELRSVSPSPVPSKKVSGPDFDRPSQLAEAAGDLFLPSEKGSPPRRGRNFRPRRGSLSPARGSRRTFSARRSLGAHRSTPDESLLSLFSEKTPIHSRSVFYARSTFSEAPQGAALP
jgi:hypothetical protein